jgi:hypothetical protein
VTHVSASAIQSSPGRGGFARSTERRTVRRLARWESKRVTSQACPLPAARQRMSEPTRSQSDVRESVEGCMDFMQASMES